jgi:hypothetical protein
MLTEHYKQTVSGGRHNYERFWNGITHVSVSDVQTNPPGTVTATLDYQLRNGGDSVERTRFGLVRDGQQLKIDSSAVLDSSTR